MGRASEDIYLGSEAAQGTDMGLGDCSQPQPRRWAVEACGGQATKDVAPEAFLTIAITAIGTTTGAVNLDAVHRARLTRGDDLLADVLRVFPVLAAGAMVVLREVAKAVQFGDQGCGGAARIAGPRRPTSRWSGR